GVVNDREGRVTVVLERRMLAQDPLNYHPLVNDRTTAISPGDLEKFLAACGHAPLILELDDEKAAAAAGGSAAGVASAGESRHVTDRMLD
ncbi:MAG: hypothetical protein ACHQF3_12675, partial [Alphaproteobacteria bacterium]